MKLSKLGASAVADALCRQVNGGTLRIYNAADVLLATIGFQSTAFLPAIDGLAKSHPLTAEHNAPFSGAADYYDACDPAGQVIWSGIVGEDMEMDSPHIASGARVKVEAVTISFPAGE